LIVDKLDTMSRKYLTDQCVSRVDAFQNVSIRTVRTVSEVELNPLSKDQCEQQHQLNIANIAKAGKARMLF
ncbi:MAG: hypothetical protein ABR512_13685, partial [Desulfopila sp.]